MFYAQIFTSKRGTLAKIWLAAHWEKKITKAHVFECDLETTIKEILSPQIKIGLRTSGHLLLGVVRIYSRKTRYLLADCSDALVRIKVAFRPGQTDLPEDAMEATLKTITLPEDFTDFESQLPDPNSIDVVDHFSLNQCRTEDITLKENFGNLFLSMERIGDEMQSYQGLFDQSFSVHGDCFGDEEMAVDLIDVIASATEDSLMPDFCEDTPNVLPATPPPTAVNELEPEFVKPDRSCLNGRNSPALTETTFLVNAEEGFALPPVVTTPVLENTAHPVLNDWSLLQDSVDPGQTGDVDTTVEASFTRPGPPAPLNSTSVSEPQEDSRMEVSYPESLPEISMSDQDSSLDARKTLVTQTQSTLDSQDVEVKKMTSRAHNLLQALKMQDSSPSAVYSLHTLCESHNRSYVAATFFCFLVLKKQQMLNLHQSAPYSDITATPGPLFSSL